MFGRRKEIAEKVRPAEADTRAGDAAPLESALRDKPETERNTQDEPQNAPKSTAQRPPASAYSCVPSVKTVSSAIVERAGISSCCLMRS